MVSEDIAELVREERKRQGLDLESLAERAGCSKRILEYWENGKRKPTEVETIDKVLKALNVTYTLGGDKRETLKKSGIMNFEGQRLY